MIRILVVDDQRVIRQGLRALLDPEPDFQVVGDADNGQVAVDQIAALQPDVVLLDIWMPIMDGIVATQIIQERFPGTKVLVLSGSDDQDSLSQALQAGALGYLLKDTPAEEIAQAIRSVYRGYAQVGPGLFEKIVGRVSILPTDRTLRPIASEPQASELPQLDVLRLLKGFEPLALTQLVRQAVKQQSESALFNRVCQYLERRPTNVAALYLAGALAQSQPTAAALAPDYLYRGLRAGIQQRLVFSDLLLFYREGFECNPDAVLSWFTPSRGLVLDQSAWSVLLQEAAQIGDSSTGHYRTLLLLRQIHAALTLSQDCLLLWPKLEELQRSVNQLTAELSV